MYMYLHTLYMRAAKVQASLHISAGSPEPSLLDNAKTKLSCTASIIFSNEWTIVFLTDSFRGYLDVNFALFMSIHVL